MKNQYAKRPLSVLLRLFACVLLALLLCAAGDGAYTLLRGELRMRWFLLFFAAVTAALFLFRRWSTRKMLRLSLWFVLVCVLALLVTGGIWLRFSRSSALVDADGGKAALYAGKRVMVLVPHQDDELMLMGGVTEEYRKYGSEVYVVFATAGDYYDLGQQRMAEAIDALALCGVDEEHIIFLGWGNEWQGEHIYNAAPDALLTSRAGYTAAYALPTHPAYREGRPYTRENMLADLESLLLELRPDVIFCNDYDQHIDHAALSFFFEEAMGNILRRTGDYTPLVFKGMVYSLSFYAEDDFYTPNIRSTVNPYAVPYLNKRSDYRWNGRVRLPVAAASLARSLPACSQFQALRRYGSQTAWENAPSVLNGDRCFWLRPTTSLCYGAEVRVSSGRADVLTDFKRMDSADVGDFSRLPYENTWVTDPGDGERCAVVTFPGGVTLSAVVLCDAPDMAANVLDAGIVFDDGYCVETGALEPGGAPTAVEFEPRTVSAFTLRILSAEGEGAGITELEAYTAAPDTGLSYIKLMNADGDFVYDYRIDRGGTERFSLYCHGAPGLSAGDYTVSCAGKGCSAAIEADAVTVTCPRGRSCTVTLRSADGGLSDTVFISNPSPLKNRGQRIEDFAWHNAASLRQCSLCRLVQPIIRLL